MPSPCASPFTCSHSLSHTVSKHAADTTQRATGLNLAVATMRVGERAAVYVTDPSYGYGEKGSFSFPSVPPSCQLVYEVDMIAWEPPAEVSFAGCCTCCGM
mgnify:CR=1 FL=1